MVQACFGLRLNDAGSGAPHEGEDDAMTLDHRRSPLGVPHEVEVPDRIPKERYFDPEFFALRPSSSGPGSGRWPAGSRRSPASRDFVEYEILDRSVIVVRTSETEVRGLRELVPPPRRQGRRGPRHAQERLHLPLPRLVLRPRRHEHLRL